jgi:hypothetical protein
MLSHLSAQLAVTLTPTGPLVESATATSELSIPPLKGPSANRSQSAYRKLHVHELHFPTAPCCSVQTWQLESIVEGFAAHGLSL